MITMDEIIKKAGELEPLPLTAIKLSKIIADQKSTINDIVEVIQYDEAITAKVFKYANCVFYAGNRSITTLKEAVIRLGSGRILEYSIGGHLKKQFKTPLPTYGYSEDDLWRHSVASAVASEVLINSFIKKHISGITFTAALMHDIGKLILVRAASEEDMSQIWDMVQNESSPCTCEQAEKEVLGYSHADIGAELTRLWKLPVEIVRAIHFHHSVNKAFDPITDVVRIANIVARSIGEGIGKEGMNLAIDDNISDRLELTKESFEKICITTSEKLEIILEMFEI